MSLVFAQVCRSCKCECVCVSATFMDEACMSMWRWNVVLAVILQIHKQLTALFVWDGLLLSVYIILFQHICRFVREEKKVEW